MTSLPTWTSPQRFHGPLHMTNTCPKDVNTVYWVAYLVQHCITSAYCKLFQQKKKKKIFTIGTALGELKSIITSTFRTPREEIVTLFLSLACPKRNSDHWNARLEIRSTSLPMSSNASFCNYALHSSSVNLASTACSRAGTQRKRMQ